MLCYISCTNTEGYNSFYYGDGNISAYTWTNYDNLFFKPTFMHIFKMKQLIEDLKSMDSKNGDEPRYTYSVIPVLHYIYKE